MDDQRFDALTRLVSIVTTRPNTRRTALAGVAALLTGWLTGRPSGAQRRPMVCHPLGKMCFPERGIGCCGKVACRRGRCRCGQKQRACHGRCISKQRCCHHRDCGRGQTCRRGRCQCPAGTRRHGQRCVPKPKPKPKTKPSRPACPAAETSCHGQCVNLQTDTQHCGACDNACAGTATCQQGACNGGSTYQELRRWSQDNWDISGIAVDQAGLVYVTDIERDRVWKFTANGGEVDSWSVPGFPFGIDITPDGLIYVANSSLRQIVTYTDVGSPGPLTISTSRDPVALAVGPGGDIYATFTFDSGVVRHFNSDGTLNATWSAFNIPYWVAVAPNGDVYVTNYGVHEVVWLSATGTVKGEWGTQGSGNGEIENPTGITVDGAGFVYVADWGNSRIQKFTANGQFVGMIGSADAVEEPIDIAVSRSGMVYVTDHASLEVVQFEPA